MRNYGVLFLALLISVAGNLALLRWNNSLRAERDAARAEVALLEQARAADAHAISTYETVRNEAAATAQGRRDALSNINPTDSDSDVLQRCRSGLCIKREAQGRDSSSGPADAVSPSVNAGSPASR